jgi:glycine cleavage system H protein
METPEELKYTEEHEWVKLDGNTAVVGITDYAQGELGDVVFVELPEPGTEVQKGGVFGTIEAVKTVSDLYSPLSGKIVAINEQLTDRPEAINQSPYGEGWMIRIEASDSVEANELMDAAGYRSHVGEEG